MKNLLFAALLGSTALVTSAAMAQQQTDQDATQQTDQDALQTQQTGQATEQQQAMTGQMEMEDGFIVGQQQNQMVASNLMDAEVIGADNERIGTVDDLLLDRDGRIAGVVVGVGGFLEIGEKAVAIPSDSLDFVLAGDPEALGSGAAGTQSGTAGTAGTATTAQPGVAGTGTAGTADPAADGGGETPGTAAGTAQPDATGTGTTGMVGTADTTADSRMGVGWGWTGEQIDHIRVDFTREQLEAAPEFTSMED